MFHHVPPDDEEDPADEDAPDAPELDDAAEVDEPELDDAKEDVDDAKDVDEAEEVAADDAEEDEDIADEDEDNAAEDPEEEEALAALADPLELLAARVPPMHRPPKHACSESHWLSSSQLASGTGGRHAAMATRALKTATTHRPTPRISPP